MSPHLTESSGSPLFAYECEMRETGGANVFCSLIPDQVLCVASASVLNTSSKTADNWMLKKVLIMTGIHSFILYLEHCDMDADNKKLLA